MGNRSSSAIPIPIPHSIPNATIIQQVYTKNPIGDLIENAIAAKPIPLNVLIAIGAEWKESHGKAIGILGSTSGITSLLSSSIFIWMILRSHERLSTTQHRLLLGLCICDIIFSSSASTFNAMAPSENDYFIWNAKGNQHTCTAGGFLSALGIGGGIFYNASLNLYFLAVVKYNKSNEFIRAKIEPFLHGVPIALNLSYSIYHLIKKHYNANGTGACLSSVNTAAHCRGYDVGEVRDGFEIPCWRGAEGAWTETISSLVLIFIPAVIIMVSLGVIYSAVRTQEKKLARYGVGALRSNLQLQQQQSVSTPQQRTERGDDKQSSSMWGRMTISLTALSTSLMSRTWSCSKKSNKSAITRSNNVKSQSRAVMHKAFGYTFAWFLAWGFNIIGTIILAVTGRFPLVLVYLVTIFGPLQGFFNLLIFMHPRIMAAKKTKKRDGGGGGGGGTVSWCSAFSIAFWSRGKGVKNQGSTSRSNLRLGGNSHRLNWKTQNEDALLASDNVKSQTFGRIKGKKKKNRVDAPQEEEEKCEIQVPDHLDPSKTKAMYSAASTATYAPNIVPSLTETTNTSSNSKLASNTTPGAAMAVQVNQNESDENVDVGSTISDVLENADADADEHAMLNHEEEIEMKEAKNGGNLMDIGTVDGTISAS